MTPDSSIIDVRRAKLIRRTFLAVVCILDVAILALAGDVLGVLVTIGLLVFAGLLMFVPAGDHERGAP